MMSHFLPTKRIQTVGCLLLLLCVTSCGIWHKAPSDSVPSISAEALYALVPAVEAETPSIQLSPTAQAIQRKREEDAQLAVFADTLIAEAYRHLGTPYSYGALGPGAFDCSGFVRHVYSRFGYDLPHSSSEMAQVGRPVESSVGHYSQLQKGDIVLFGGRRTSGTIGHVGIFIAADPDGCDGTFIHAAVHGGVIVSRFSEEYYTTRFHGARRVL